MGIDALFDVYLIDRGQLISAHFREGKFSVRRGFSPNAFRLNRISKVSGWSPDPHAAGFRDFMIAADAPYISGSESESESKKLLLAGTHIKADRNSDTDPENHARF
jgi:hypothetical protein